MDVNVKKVIFGEIYVIWANLLAFGKPYKYFEREYQSIYIIFDKNRIFLKKSFS